MLTFLNPQQSMAFMVELLKRQEPAVVRATAMAAMNVAGGILVLFQEQAARLVTDPACIDEICSLWAETRSPALLQLIKQKGWVARSPDRIRVLTTLVCLQGDLLQAEAFEMLPHLLEALQDKDSDCVRQAALLLLNLKDQRAKEEMCRLVIDDRHPDALIVVLKAGYYPADLERRALFFLLTEQLERYEALDYDARLLRSIYLMADDRLRRNIAQLIQKTGRQEYVQAIARGSQEYKISDFGELEWETIWSVLTRAQRCADMWALAQAAPTRQSLRFFMYLLEQRWQPETAAEREQFIGLKEVVENEQNKLTSKKPPYKINNSHPGEVHFISSKGNCMLTSRLVQVNQWTIENHFFLVDTNSGQERKELNLENIQLDHMNILMTPDEKYMILDSGQMGPMIIIDIDTGKRLPPPQVSKKIYKGYLRWIPIPEMGMLLGAASDFLGLWSIPDTQMISGGYINPEESHYSWEVNLNPGQFYSFISQDGRRYLQAMGNELNIWSLPDITRLSCSPIDLDRYISFGERIVDASFTKDKAVFAHQDGHHNIVVKTFSLTPDGIFNESSKITIKPDEKRKFDAFRCSIKLSPDGRYLLISDGGTHLYNLDAGEIAGIPSVAKSYFFNEAMSLLIQDTDDDCFSIWDLNNRLVIAEICNQPQHYSRFLFHPTHKKFIHNTWSSSTPQRESCFRIWDIGIEQWFGKPVTDLLMDDIIEMERMSEDPEVDLVTKSWLRYCLALHRNLHLFDIEVEETKKISIGEYDILI